MDIQFEIAELNRRLANIVRPGKVDSVDYDNAKAKVKSGEVVTGWLPWATLRAGGDRSWWAPEVNEQVVVLSPSGELAQGFILPSFYSDSFAAPADSKDVRRDVYADGLIVEHNRQTKRTVINAWDSEGTLELRAKNIILKTGDGGFFHVDHAGYAERITHDGGANYTTDTWKVGATVTGNPDQGHSPPEVDV